MNFHKFFTKSISFWNKKISFWKKSATFVALRRQKLEIKHLHTHQEYFKHDFLKNQISHHQDFQTVADIFSLLADSSRLKIFWLLCHSKECVINIAQALSMSNPAVSHHLKILRESGLIESYRDEREVFYTVSANAKNQALHSIIEKLMSINCPDFDSKANYNRRAFENLCNECHNSKNRLQGCLRKLHCCPHKRTPHGKSRRTFGSLSNARKSNCPGSRLRKPEQVQRCV